MSRRNRKRRQDRILNSEFKAESAPRGFNHPLPQLDVVRVRPLSYKQPRDKFNFGLESIRPEQFRDLRRIDRGKIVQDLRRLHIETDLLTNNIDPTGERYVYKRLKVGRDEQVFLNPEHPICREREERKQVLFAKNKAGKGGQKPPHLPQFIIKCEKRRK